MKGIFLIQICALLTLSAAGQGSKSYETGYFALLDRLIDRPYDFLGKTSFQVSSMDSPPAGMPIENAYWRVKIDTDNSQGDGDVESVARISTGYSPIDVAFHSRSRKAFQFGYYASMGIDFAAIKRHFESKKIFFNEFGQTEIRRDVDNRGSYVIELTKTNDVAVLIFFPIDEATKKPLYQD
jgi:hypothetical protein